MGRASPLGMVGDRPCEELDRLELLLGPGGMLPVVVMKFLMRSPAAKTPNGPSSETSLPRKTNGRMSSNVVITRLAPPSSSTTDTRTPSPAAGVMISAPENSRGSASPS
jgi:hypothetical protein